MYFKGFRLWLEPFLYPCKISRCGPAYIAMRKDTDAYGYIYERIKSEFRDVPCSWYLHIPMYNIAKNPGR